MKVTILTSAYNAAVFMERYYSGLAAQTYRPIELIFVDDGSTDQTTEKFKEVMARGHLTNVQVINLRQENQGPPAAMNYGLQYATGDLILPLDADDQLLPGGVEAFVRTFQENPDAWLVCAEHRCVNEKGVHFNGRRVGPSLKRYPNLLWAILAEGMLAVAGSYCYRRDSLNLLPQGRLTVAFQAQNLEILLHTGAQKPVAYCEAETVEIYAHPDSRSRAKTLERLARKVNGSHRLQRLCAEIYKVPWDIRSKMERRLLPLEIDYYFLTGQVTKLLQCIVKLWQVDRLTKKHSMMLCAAIFPSLKSVVIERYFAGYAI
jgi:glycosyltransferase involved in cell wall biosynthesis